MRTWIDLRREFQEKIPILLAAQHPKLEAWLLNAFEPENAQEEGRLANERTALGFDPRIHAHKLTAEGAKGRRNAKTVLDKLTGGSFDRAEAAMDSVPLQTLRERGEETGLAAYVGEVNHRLLPLLTETSRHRDGFC